jgi:hypothetical protein
MDRRSPARGLVLGAATVVGARVVERLLAAGHEVVARDELMAGDVLHLERAAESPRFRFEHDDAARALPEGFDLVLDVTEAGPRHEGAAYAPTWSARAARLHEATRRPGLTAVLVARRSIGSSAARHPHGSPSEGALRILFVDDATERALDGDDVPSDGPRAEALDRFADAVLACAREPELLVRCRTDAQAAGEAHRLGDAMVAAERLIVVSGRLEELHRALVGAGASHPAAAALDAELRARVVALGEAQLRRDPVGIADQLEYEVVPLLARCAHALASVRGTS